MKSMRIGAQRDRFSITFALGKVIGVERFVARTSELRKIREALASDGSRRAVVVHGLGGIGKTQLAIAYAKRFQNSHSAVFWINAKDTSTLMSSYASLAKQILLDHPSAPYLVSLGATTSADRTIDAVKSWLSIRNNTRWLMVFDNLDNPKVPGNDDPAAVDIRDFLPGGHQGSILVTTRSSQLSIGHHLHLTKLGDVNDSLSILADSSRRGDLSGGMHLQHGHTL